MCDLIYSPWMYRDRTFIGYTHTYLSLEIETIESFSFMTQIKSVVKKLEKTRSDAESISLDIDAIEKSCKMRS